MTELIKPDDDDESTIVRVPAEAETQDAPTGPRFAMKPYGYHETHESLTEIGESNRNELDELGYAEVEAKQYSTLEWLSDEWQTTLIADLYENATATRHDPAPEYTLERHMERMKEVQENTDLPEKYLWELNEAVSDEQFDDFFTRTYERWQQEERIAAGRGWGGFAASLPIQFVGDPTQWPLVLTGPIAVSLASSRKGLSLVEGGIGAASGLVSTAARDAAGRQPDAFEYLLTTGASGAMGAVFGPLGRNGRFVKTRQKMHEQAEREVKQARELKAEWEAMQGPAKPSATSAVKRAAKGETPTQAAPEPPAVKPLTLPPKTATAAELKAFAAEHNIPLSRKLQKGRNADIIRQAIDAHIAKHHTAQSVAEPVTVQVTTDEAVSLGDVLTASRQALDGSLDELPDVSIVEEQIRGIRQQLNHIFDDPSVVDELEAQLSQLEGFSEFIQQQRGASPLDVPPNVTVNVIEDVPTYPQSAGAAVNLEGAFMPFTDKYPNWKRFLRAVNIADTAFKNVRWDLFARLDRYSNPIIRVANRLFHNDSVGNKDYTKSWKSADQTVRRLQRSVTTHFHEVRRGAFSNYADAMGYNRAERVYKEREFANYVGRRILGDTSFPEHELPAEAVKAIDQVVAASHQTYRDFWDHIMNPGKIYGETRKPLLGADEVTPHEPYTGPRMWLASKIAEAKEKHGPNALFRTIKAAIRAAQPTLKHEYLDRLARGFTDNVLNRAYGLEDEFSIAFTDKDAARFAYKLREMGQFTNDEIDDIMSTVFASKLDTSKNAGRSPHLKNRVLMDVNAPDPHTGLRVLDMIETNIDNMMGHYSRSMSGRIALAGLQIKAPDGEIVFDGIRSEADLENLFDVAKNWAAEQGDRHLPAETERAIQELRFSVDRIKGIPDPRLYDQEFGQAVKALKDYNYIRLMWQPGWAQLGEAGTVVGILGATAAFQHMPAFRRVIDSSTGAAKLVNEMKDEIEHIGLGHQPLQGANIFHHYDQAFDGPFNDVRGVFDRVSAGLSIGTRVVSRLNIMEWITALEERWAAAVFFQKLSRIGEKVQAGKPLSDGDVKRMAQLGLDENDMNAIFDQMAQFTTKEQSGLFAGHKVARMNLNKWTDQQARANLEHGVYKMVTKLIQQGDLGNMPFWNQSLVGQVVSQFRTFTFTAWNNNLLYNLHMRDFAALMSMIWSTGWATAVRAIQVNTAAQFMADPQAYRERHLEPEKLIADGIQRTGYASVLPMFIDTAFDMTGENPRFGGRSTGQASHAAFGNPSFGLMNDVYTGVAGILQSFADDRQMTQPEVRAMFNTLPGATSLFVQGAVSRLIEDRPFKVYKDE